LNLSALAVKRPIATATILLVILVIGLVSLYQSPLDLLPEIQAPVLAVITVFPGSSPQETLELVTKPIEDSVSAVSGLTALNSFSRENLSLVILRFNWGSDIKKVREDVNVRMDLISFPDGVQRPLLFEFDPTLLPIMQVSASGSDDPIVLTNWLEEKALPRLESLSGVASVQIQGGAREDLFIRITPEVMAEYEISFEQIANVLRASLIDLPAGIIELDDRQVRVRFLGRYADSDLLSDLIVGFKIDQDQLAKLVGQEVDINLNQFLSGQNGGFAAGSSTASRPVPVSELYWDDLFNFDQAIFTGGNLILPLNADWVAQSDGDMTSSLRLFTVNPAVSYDQGLQSLVMSIETFGQIPLLDESSRIDSFGNNNVVRLSDIWLINQAELDNGYLIVPLDQSRLYQNEVTFEQIRLLAANHPLIVESSPEQIIIAYHQDWERVRREPIVAVPDYRAWLDGVQSDVQQGIGDTSRLLEDSLTEIATTMILSSMMPGNSSFGAISFDEDFPIEPISLGSLAEIKQDTYNPSTISRYNRLPSIGLVMQKEGDANTVVVARQLRAELQKLSAESENAEFQVQFNTIFDQAAEIESALADLAWSLVGGALLAVLVLIFFLRNWRTTLFIAISIPAAIITTFTLLYFTDLTINLMTLGGLALAAGMLVDNAIVVSENIYRHYQMGKEPAAAAVEGADEVAGAVTASTLTTLSVFFPVVFLSGLAGQLFWEFALTVACAILASLVVALTVIPLMASRSLSRDSKSKNNEQLFEKEATYHRLLGLAVRYPWWVLLFAAFFVLVGVFAYGTLGSELFPSPDESAYRIDITLPPGVIMQATDDYVAEVEAILSARPEVLAFSARIGGGGFIGAPGEGGLASEAQVRVEIEPEFVGEINLLMDEVRKELESLPVDAEVTFTRESLLAAAGLDTGLELVISGSDLTEVIRLTGQAVTMLKQHPLFTDIQSSFEESRPEVHIRLDHGQALQKGVTLIQVATAVRQALEGIPVSRIETDSGVLNIVLGYQQRDINSVEDLGNIGFYSPSGEYLQLNQVAELSEAFGPQSIPRENQQIIGQIQIQYTDLDLGTATEEALKILEDLSLPAGYDVRTAGSSNLMGDVMSELQLVMIVAAILVYLVMAAQFESLLHPFIIICSLPLAYAGSVLALIITGNEVSIPAMIGVVVLSGILVNDGIIMVDFINQQRRIHGLPLVEAIVEGAAARLRPILMTTATTVLGLVPLAMGLGEGGQLQAPMAITIIGGQITGTLLLLLAIPSIYKLVNREKNTTPHYSARPGNKVWPSRVNGSGNGRDRQFIKLVLRMIVTLAVAVLIFYLIKVYL
jgi:hydrophobic/amphiphilic exporter-1 (mainly G- bacteria), HAE1 family